MKFRRQLPPAVQERGRRAAVSFGQYTAHKRLKPSFILAGGQRCGTTSLFRALEQHPQIVRPSFHKGINYFDLNYHRGASWYAGHFPLASRAIRRSAAGAEPVAFEASGYYMFHPHAIPRIARDLPEVKIVLMLRDPVERAYSAWKHEYARGYEVVDFMQALNLEEDRLKGEVARMISDPTYESFSHRHHAYAARSDYLTQLTRILEHIPLERLHIIFSEQYFNSPDSEFSALVEFLDATYAPNVIHDQHNAQPSGTMPEDARNFLHHRLAPTYTELASLVRRSSPWPEP